MILWTFVVVLGAIGQAVPNTTTARILDFIIKGRFLTLWYYTYPIFWIASIVEGILWIKDGNAAKAGVEPYWKGPVLGLAAISVLAIPAMFAQFLVLLFFTKLGWMANVAIRAFIPPH